MRLMISFPFLYLYVGVMICASCTNRNSGYGPDIYVPDTTFKVVGYLSTGNFNQIDLLELDKLNYLNLAFANPDAEGNLVVDRNADIKPVVQRGHDLNLKVFISLAGGGRPDTVIWKSLLLPENRSAFIKKILNYTEVNNLDGVDVDIEWNLLPYLGDTYNPFVIELREALHSRGKGITSALGATGLHKAVGQEALEAYGFDFAPPARYISYKAIIKENPSFAYQDSIGRRYYYNGIRAIVKKTQLAKNNLGGLMIWEIASDTTGDLSLLRALSQTLEAGDCTVITFYKDEDGDGYGDMARPFHACIAPQGYVTNMDDKDDTNPKVHP